MKVIRHQAKGVNLPTGLGASLAQRGEKPLAIFVVLVVVLVVVGIRMMKGKNIRG